MCSKVTQDVCMVMRFGSSWRLLGMKAKTAVGVTWDTLVGETPNLISYFVEGAGEGGGFWTTRC